MSKSSKFLAGALLGAAAAALLSPVSGKSARNKVKKVAQKAGVDTKKLESNVNALAGKGKGVISSVIQKAAQQAKIKNNKK
jgi:gas vesicle protein